MDEELTLDAGLAQLAQMAAELPASEEPMEEMAAETIEEPGDELMEEPIPEGDPTPEPEAGIDNFQLAMLAMQQVAPEQRAELARMFGLTPAQAAQMSETAPAEPALTPTQVLAKAMEEEGLESAVMSLAQMLEQSQADAARSKKEAEETLAQLQATQQWVAGGGAQTFAQQIAQEAGISTAPEELVKVVAMMPGLDGLIQDIPAMKLFATLAAKGADSGQIRNRAPVPTAAAATAQKPAGPSVPKGMENMASEWEKMTKTYGLDIPSFAEQFSQVTK